MDASETDEQVQLAAAICVINTRPEGVSTEEHVKWLAEKLQCSKSNSQYEDLHKEIVRLKQIIAVNDLQVNVDMLLPSHAELPQIYYQNHPEEAKVHNEVVATMVHRNYEELERHTHFIQKIIYLYSILTKSGSHRELIAWSSHTNNAAISTLNAVIEFLSDEIGVALPEKIWEGTLNHISCFLHTVSNETFQSSVAELCTEWIKKIRNDIMCFDTLDQFQFQTRRTSLILTLSRNKIIREKVVQLFLEAIARYAHYLRTVVINDEDLIPQSFENIYYVFEALEKIFIMYRYMPDQPLPPDWSPPNPETCVTWLNSLEISLQLSTYLFPLFTTYAWDLRVVLYDFLKRIEK